MYLYIYIYVCVFIVRYIQLYTVSIYIITGSNHNNKPPLVKNMQHIFFVKVIITRNNTLYINLRP